MGSSQSRPKASAGRVEASVPAIPPPDGSNVNWSKLVPPPRFSVEDPVEIVQRNSNISEGENSEDENESFQGWLSTPPNSEPRDSIDSHSANPGQSTRDTSKKRSDEAPSSTEWLDQRPSSDTPLHPSTAPTKDAQTVVTEDNVNLFLKSDLHASRSSKEFASRSSTSSPTHDEGEVPNRLSECSSAVSESTVSGGASVRSSFALERASIEANRISLEAFKGASLLPSTIEQIGLQKVEEEEGRPEQEVTLDMLVSMANLPSELSEYYASLVVFSPQTPVPVSTLAHLWEVSPDSNQLSNILGMFTTRGILTIAKLPSGQVWALPQSHHLQLLQNACKDLAPQFHARLIDGYSRGVNNQRQNLACAPDDGYFLANIGHHIAAAGHLDTLKDLLFDCVWLERKLKACGPATVVADFRRFLIACPTVQTAKLVLESFQMSAGLVQSHPRVPGLLRSLMIGRLMSASLPDDMKEWIAKQRVLVIEDGDFALAAGLPRPLPPKTPSLDQAGGLQRLAFKGHCGSIGKILLSPSGTEVVSGGNDGTARLWDLEIGDCILCMEGHTGPIRDMGITADGSLLITASDDGTARAFELERGQCLRVLSGHQQPINALIVDPQGRYIVTASSDATIRVWDLSSAKTIYVFVAPEGARCVDISPCRRFILAGCDDDSVRIFDLHSGRSMGVLRGHTRWISAVLFLPDGKRAISASHDTTIRIWSLRTGRCHAVLEHHHGGRINTISLSKNGRLLASGDDNGVACLWDTKTFACLKMLRGHNAWISHVHIYPKGDRVLTTSGDRTSIVWSVDTGDIIRVLEGHSGPVLNAVVTRRGRFAVTGSDDGTLRVWDFAAADAKTPTWHEGRIRTIAARDGMVVATAGDDCMVRLWNSNTGEYQGSVLPGKHSIPVRWAQFSVDGSKLVTVSPDRTICVWNCTTCCIDSPPELMYQLPTAKGSRMKSFAASGDVDTCVICLFDSTVVVWDIQSGQPIIELQKWGQRDSASGHTSAVNEVLMSADASTVVTLSKDSTARVWDVASGTCRLLLSGHTDSIAGGCLSQCGRMVVTHSYDASLKVWKIDGSVESPLLATLPLPTALNEANKVGNTNPTNNLIIGSNVTVTKLVLTRQSHLLAAALSDGSILLCAIDANEYNNNDKNDDNNKNNNKGAVRMIPTHLIIPDHAADRHKDLMTDVDFSQDGDAVIVSSEDGTVRMFNTKTGIERGFFVSNTGITCCHYDQLNECIVAGTDRGVVHFINTAS